MREVAVVEGRDEEHARDVQGGADPERGGRDSHHHDERTGGVQRDERRGAQGVDPSAVRMGGGFERARVVDHPARDTQRGFSQASAMPLRTGGPHIVHGGAMVRLTQ